MRFDPITYGSLRKHQMAAYSERHYGEREWRLRKVRALIFHYTAGPSYTSAWNTFESNAPNLGEYPGVCTQFVVDQDGTIYRLTKRDVRCRHTIGLNHRSIGIEMVQEALSSPAATSQAILDRGPQARAVVRLSAWLKQLYDLKMRNLIGHAMANDSPLFQERTSWRNDHSDWQAPQVRKLHRRIAGLIYAGHNRAAAPRGIASGALDSRSARPRRGSW